MSYSISSKEEYIKIELTGTISKEVVIEALKQLLNTPGYYHGKSVIWIATRADLSGIDLEIIDQGVKEIDAIFEGLRIGKTALVTERAINESIVRLFKEIYNRDVVSVFNSFGQAEQWILNNL